MDEFGAAFQFFEGFGENWYALEDCLECLDEWLPADSYILIVECAEEMLCEEIPEELTLFLITMDRVGKSWSKSIEDNGRFNRKSIPFHALLHVSPQTTNGCARFTKAALKSGISVGELRDPNPPKT